MILDAFENVDLYLPLNKGFVKAVEFLGRPDLASLSPDKYEIDGDNIFASVFKGPGRTRDEAFLEIHKKYIDIQWVLSGVDTMGWKPACDCKKALGPYDPQKDIQFFSEDPDAWVATQSGAFVIFFPEDAHLPLISSEEIHKVIVKIKVEG